LIIHQTVIPPYPPSGGLNQPVSAHFIPLPRRRSFCQLFAMLRNLAVMTMLFTPPAVAGADWSELPALPDAHGFAGAFAGIHHGFLLAGGGANFPDGVMPWNGGRKVWHARLFALDLGAADARWREIGKLPVPNGYGVSLTTSEGILMIGGGDAEGNFRSVTMMTFDGTKPAFRKLPDLPVPLAQMTGALVGRKVHICGGIETPDATSATNGHWTLDLARADEGWKSFPPLPAEGRILATSAVIGDAFVIAGGCSLSPNEDGKPKRHYLCEAWMFADGKWRRLADLPRAAVAAASPSPVRDGKMFIVSGDDGQQVNLASPAEHRGFTKDVLCFDPAANAWFKAGEIAGRAPVTLPAVPWRDGFILVNGEIKPGVRTPSVSLFKP
jgi:N-acetylneuraminate epimerase